MEQEDKNTAQQSTDTSAVQDNENKDDSVEVDLQKAEKFVSLCKDSGSTQAWAAFICICSPVVLILMTAAATTGMIQTPADQAAQHGLLIMIIMIIIGIILFVSAAMQNGTMSDLKTKPLIRTDEVDEKLRDERGRYQSVHTRQMAIGIALVISSSIPLLIGRIVRISNAFTAAVVVSVILVLIALGIFFIARTSSVWSAYHILLEEGGYSRVSKSVNSNFGTYYWAAVVIIYLVVSFLTTRWDITWIFFLAAAALYRPLFSKEKRNEQL